MKAKILVLGLTFLVASGAGLFLAYPGAEAETKTLSKDAKELLELIESDAALTLRLCALEKFRKMKDTGIESELVDLAKGDDEILAIHSATSLGRRKTSTAKAELKKLLEDTKLDKSVRIGALSTIAWQWKDKSDLSYLDSKTKGDSKLASQYAWLKKEVYGVKEGS